MTFRIRNISALCALVLCDTSSINGILLRHSFKPGLMWIFLEMGFNANLSSRCHKVYFTLVLWKLLPNLTKLKYRQALNLCLENSNLKNFWTLVAYFHVVFPSILVVFTIFQRRYFAIYVLVYSCVDCIVSAITNS